MTEKTYIRNGEEFIVEEYGRREFASLVGQCVEDARWANDCDMPYEDTIFVQYKDGSTFSYYDAFGFEGRFLKTNIVFGVITNSCTQQVTGSYDVDENGIVQAGMSYRIYKGYSGTKCIRKFDSLEKAKTWCWVRDHDEPYRIEWVEEADEEHCIPERRCSIFE